jgi:hypothetical protein
MNGHPIVNYYLVKSHMDDRLREAETMRRRARRQRSTRRVGHRGRRLPPFVNHGARVDL